MAGRRKEGQILNPKWAELVKKHKDGHYGCMIGNPTEGNYRQVQKDYHWHTKTWLPTPTWVDPVNPNVSGSQHKGNWVNDIITRDKDDD